MTTLFKRIGFVVGVLTLFGMIAVTVPANAQAPVNPTASSVKEDQLLQQLRQLDGRVTIPDAKSSVLIQPAGQAWRQFHEVTLYWLSGIAILGMLVLLVIFYLVRGMVRLESGRSGRTIVRFNAFERFVHWMTAACFIVLAISGLNITFGKTLLLPWMSAEAFTAWSQWAKYAHNYLSFPFALGVIVTFLMWIAWNIPTGTDVRWFKEGGGIVGHKHPPAPRFNGGQKLIHWIVVLGGAAVAITGYILMFPFYVTDVGGMQLAQMIHGIVAVLFVAVMLAHIYIGTIGMEGAFEAMWDGNVDVNWAKEHHSIWAEKQMGKAQPSPPPAQGSMAPAE